MEHRWLNIYQVHFEKVFSSQVVDRPKVVMIHENFKGETLKANHKKDDANHWLNK